MKKLAVVGLGKWGKNLVREFSKISTVVVCNSDGKKENIQWLKKNYPNTRYSENLQELLQNKSIDAIVIASPIKSHYSLSHQVLKSNKHVFIEKTISENSEDAKKLITTAKRKGLIIFTGHIFLYHPILKRIKEMTKNETIVYLKLNWMKLDSFQEDILLDLASHFISIIIELLGIPKDIKIINVTKIVSSYDIITIEFGFKVQRKCIIDINRISNFKKRSVTIVTTKNIFHWEDNTLYKFNKKKLVYQSVLVVPDKTPLEIECKTFIQSLNDKPDYSNPDKALKIVQLIEKCREMIK